MKLPDFLTEAAHCTESRLAMMLVCKFNTYSGFTDGEFTGYLNVTQDK